MGISSSTFRSLAADCRSLPYWCCVFVISHLLCCHCRSLVAALSSPYFVAASSCDDLIFVVVSRHIVSQRCGFVAVAILPLFWVCCSHVDVLLRVRWCWCCGVAIAVVPCGRPTPRAAADINSTNSEPSSSSFGCASSPSPFYLYRMRCVNSSNNNAANVYPSPLVVLFCVGMMKLGMTEIVDLLLLLFLLMILLPADKMKPAGQADGGYDTVSECRQGAGRLSRVGLRATMAMAVIVAEMDVAKSHGQVCYLVFLFWTDSAPSIFGVGTNTFLHANK